jgi:hypothetical protein
MANRVAALPLSGEKGYGAQTQGNTLAQLPLASLFGAPFEAAASAQNALAHSTAKFIRQFGMDGSGNVWMNTFTSYYDIPTSSVADISGGYLLDASGGGIFIAGVNITPDSLPDVSYKVGDYCDKGTYKILVSAILKDSDRPPSGYGFTKRISNRIYILDDGGKVLYVQGVRSLSVPFISLVNVPSLFIDLVTVEFAINIKTQSVVQTNSSNAFTYANESSGESRGRGWNWGESYNYKNDYTTKTTATSTSTASATSDTSTESTYMVSMKAQQVDPPGLTAVMNFITGNKDTSSKKMLGSNGKSVITDPATVKLT